MFSAALNTSAAEESSSWYIKRNGNKRPEIQGEQEIIYKYEGYFIDKKCKDSDSEKIL